MKKRALLMTLVPVIVLILFVGYFKTNIMIFYRSTFDTTKYPVFNPKAKIGDYKEKIKKFPNNNMQYKANKNLDPQKYTKPVLRNEIDLYEQEKGIYFFKEYMTYEKCIDSGYLDSFTKYVDKDRIVYVTRIKYYEPYKIDIIEGPYFAQARYIRTINNAIETLIYDAETGESLAGSNVISLDNYPSTSGNNGTKDPSK